MLNGSQTIFGRDPEAFFDFAFNARPPIPADRIDISELVSEAATVKATEPGWAWSRLLLWLAQVESTYSAIGTMPIAAVDLGSSTPFYSHRLRFLEFDRDGIRARGLIDDMLSDTVTAELSQDKAELGIISRLLAGRQKSARRLLEAGIQESLYEITRDEAAGTHITNQRYGERLSQKLAGQRVDYTHSHELMGVEPERGLRVVSRDQGTSYLESLANIEIPADSVGIRAARQRIAEGSLDEHDIELASQKRTIGIELAREYLDWQINFVAETVVGNSRYRPARYFSMDIADPRSIALSSIANMPASVRQLDSFTHAVSSLLNPLQHIQGDILKPLPFPDNSLALITSFDSHPVTATELENYYRVQAYGGKTVIFPWTMEDQHDDYRFRSAYHRLARYGKIMLLSLASGGKDRGRALAALDNLLTVMDGVEDVRDIGDEQFAVHSVRRNTLFKYMSPADRETTAEMSSIFQLPDKYFLTLIMSKSKESTLRVLGKTKTKQT